MENAEVLVLKKNRFKESSLIVSGLSPDDGRIDFVMKGAYSENKNKFPVIDLFRVVSIEFKPVREGMPTVYSAEALDSYETLSSDPDNYLCACELARFVLDNTEKSLPCPELYGAMNHVLACLCGDHTDTLMTRHQCSLLVRLAYLNENGLLPEQLSDDPKADQLQHRLMAVLLETAQGDLPLPRLEDSYWRQLEEWSIQLCRYNGLKS
ncbi:MAG: recombination protein O N-terminal domain-containing protein [Victivallales bacterium]|nr:recombination protein O N-terminal domain-containing protein [Victivallales bacterium]